MGNAATISVKNLLSLAAIIIASTIVITLLMGVFQDINQKKQVKWINDELKPMVTNQCQRCFVCAVPTVDEDPKPGPNSRKSMSFKSDRIDIAWKGKNEQELHLVTYKDGEEDLSVRIGVDKDELLPIVSNVHGCNRDEVELTGDNLEDPGVKRFQVQPNGRGAKIDVE